jgi:predicted nucleic acid-binding protein
MELYLDTHIFVDFWNERVDKMRPLGEFAYELLRETISCKHNLLFSDLIIAELTNSCGLTEHDIWNELFSDVIRAGKLSKVQITENQKQEARDMAARLNIPRSDALHAILAKDNNAVLVSRDHHHESVRDFVKVLAPEDIIGET